MCREKQSQFQSILGERYLDCTRAGNFELVRVLGLDLIWVLRFGETKNRGKTVNPQICFFHVLFKAAALVFYILSALFVDSFVIIFVVTVLLAALDFWVVKNVSGRILVGLRWWNEITD
ncbi:Golgi apparatus membrane protein-like protein ECHIDNA [Camellia lanceoleosa]|uniref:Golgi apparatus membrane protein-like protein ECHIDNA n=1 Tax=Camellia lanceoleosa TaxID=1840588 RepID=A0ACC0GJL7_9ERIC|nr:Golgi apparatus membrane protein-like protein ECHIDNA [Camellia lanceoleosa]